MAVGAAIGQPQPAFRQALGQERRVLLDAELQPLERVALRDLERHGHGGELLRVRAALLAGEDGHVNPAGQLLIGGQDARAARPAEGLVRGEADHVRDADRAGERAGHDHAGRVADVGQQDCADLVSDIGEGLPIGRPGVRGEAGDEHLGPVRRAPDPESGHSRACRSCC